MLAKLHSPQWAIRRSGSCEKRVGNRKSNMQGKDSMRDSKTMCWTEKTAVLKDENQTLKIHIDAVRKIDRKESSKFQSRKHRGNGQAE